jgi:hypothetical protein
MTQEEAIISLKESKTLSDWNARVDAIKQAHDGDYPSWWYRAVVMSRLADEVAASGVPPSVVTCSAPTGRTLVSTIPPRERAL